MDLEKRCREIIKVADDAERYHIDAMLKIGLLVLELQEERKYINVQSAESEVSQTLKAMGAPRSGSDYVEACRMMHSKLSQPQRNTVRRYALSKQDIVVLVKLAPDRIRDCLDKIRMGVYIRQYTKSGSSYRLFELYKPAVAKRRFKRLGDSAKGVVTQIDGVSANPDVLAAKVTHNGLFDEEALVNLYAASISRFPNFWMKCWQEALLKCGVTQVRKVG